MTQPVYHVSLDNWNTLAIPNPKFAQARMEFLSEKTNYDIVEVTKQYRSVKKEMDDKAEKEGLGFATETVIGKLLKRFDIHPNRYKVDYVSKGFIKLFRKYPPIILDEIKDALKLLDAKGITYNVTSNTNFISGYTIKKTILHDINFAFTLFSDEELFSKPHQAMFDKIVEKSGVKRENILHIGDNKICDGLGAEKAGMQYIVIDNPNELAKVLKSI